MTSIRRASMIRRRGPSLGSKIPGPPPGGYAPIGNSSYAQPGSWELQRTPPRAEAGLSLMGFFFWTTFLVSAAIGYLWVYNQTDVVAVQLVETQELIQDVENANRDLQASIDQLSQIDRITRIAREELGMVTPAAESLIVYLPEVSR